MMRAVYQDRYGSPDVLELREIDKPSPNPDEVLVRVAATSVHPDVRHAVEGRPALLRLMGSGLRKPKNPVPGTDLAGEVEAVGADVSTFESGDRVFGGDLGSVSVANAGTYAEYATAPADLLAVVPEEVTLVEAGSLPNAGLIAYHSVHHLGEVGPDHHVLINGAGGGVGSIAVQLAAGAGAEVTGVDSVDKLDFVESLGADHLLDYETTDFTAGDQRYDRLFDIAGNFSYSRCKRALTDDGQYFFIGHEHFGASGGRYFGTFPRAIGLLLKSNWDPHLAGMNFSTSAEGEAMGFLADALASGDLTPTVDRTFPLESVPEAFRYLKTGKVRGRIVITV
jgi:NADPH:quinone reductase-like Zn-dependent oxidoreductase